MDERGNLYSIDTAGDNEEAEALRKWMEEALGKLTEVPAEDNRKERRAWLANRRRELKRK